MYQFKTFGLKTLELTTVEISVVNSMNVLLPAKVPKETFVIAGLVKNGDLAQLFASKGYVNLSKMYGSAEMNPKEWTYPTGFMFEDFGQALSCDIRLSFSTIYIKQESDQLKDSAQELLMALQKVLDPFYSSCGRNMADDAFERAKAKDLVDRLTHYNKHLP
jgi:hypothetical protein